MHAKPELIFSNDDLLAVNKPSGWLSIPDRHDPALPSIRKWLEGKGEQIFIVHRIDKDTSGLLLLARNEKAHKYYNSLFQNRSLEKHYFGLVTGAFSEEEGVYDQPIEEHPVIPGKMRVGRKGKAAITHYRVLERFRGYSWVAFQIETGRTHQIRVHLQNAGHALVCDPIYGSADPVLLSSFKKKFNLSKKEEEERPLMSRLALHASRVALTDLQGDPLTVEAPLAKDLDATLKQLRKWA
jgi:23S rRNA pseudouridine955/2504/2580 synthase/23S rRNA pseudouridine1911/1915/1917 synthase